MNNCSDKLLGTYNLENPNLVSFSPLSVVHYLAQFFLFSVLFKPFGLPRDVSHVYGTDCDHQGLCFLVAVMVLFSILLTSLPCILFCQAGRPCIWQCIFELVGCKRNECYKGFCDPACLNLWNLSIASAAPMYLDLNCAEILPYRLWEPPGAFVVWFGERWTGLLWPIQQMNNCC